MNRRKAIIRITLGGAGLAAAFGGYEWYGIVKSPDVGYVAGNRELLAALAETIIPATDTPGGQGGGCGRLYRNDDPGVYGSQEPE